MSKKSQYYINNQEFLAELIEYKKQCKEAKEKNQDKPIIPDSIGLSFMQIADKLSRKPNFASYTFREEMCSDGVENCVLYMDNFNPEISQNPFSYFTQIIYFAFLRRIETEKECLYAKYKATEQFGLLNENLLHSQEDGGVEVNTSLYENITEFIKTFEEKKEAKKLSIKKKPIQKKLKGIEKFIGE